MPGYSSSSINDCLFVIFAYNNSFSVCLRPPTATTAEPSYNPWATYATTSTTMNDTAASATGLAWGHPRAGGGYAPAGKGCFTYDSGSSSHDNEPNDNPHRR